MHTTIRAELPGDVPAIAALLEAAFARPDEARLVERLRADGQAEIALVAVEGASIVGYLLFSPMTAPFRALALGPVAVAPDRQGVGVGAKLIRAGLMAAAEAGW